MTEVFQSAAPDVVMDEKHSAITVEAIEADSPESTHDTPLMTPPLPDAVGAGHDNSPGPKHQAAFVNKLYSMVEDPAIREVMWTESGLTFVVTSPIEFSKCLHNYFKHNNWQSFVRQLNMYQFHKVNDVFHSNASSTATGANSSESAAWEFKHPYFQRGQVDLLTNIRRKASRPVPQSRESYGMQSRESSYHHVQHPHPYEAALSRSPAIERNRLEQVLDSINQRIQGIEDSQRILMDQTSAVFGALRGYHGILGGMTSVMGGQMPDHNIAALQSDLQALQQQLTRSQYAPRRQMHISIPPQQMSTQPLGTPSSVRSGWSQPNSPVPSIMQTPMYSPSMRSGPSDHADSYFRTGPPHQPQQQQSSSSSSSNMTVAHPVAATAQSFAMAQQQQAALAKSPPWVNHAVPSPPLSDTSCRSGAGHENKYHPHHHQQQQQQQQAPPTSSASFAPMRPGMGDRCRSLQSLLNTTGPTSG